jgi:hypothetical protein
LRLSSITLDMIETSSDTCSIIDSLMRFRVGGIEFQAAKYQV